MSIYQTKGRIFNIQRFSIHDGPGIRSIVFFKGCYMHCAWCCNPESQSYEIQTMQENGKEKIVGKDVTVEEILPELLCDLPYYRRSGGGITLSGGEILAQPDFARDLLHACKENGLHTAVESTENYDRIYQTDLLSPISAKHSRLMHAANAVNAFRITHPFLFVVCLFPLVLVLVLYVRARAIEQRRRKRRKKRRRTK